MKSVIKCSIFYSVLLTFLLSYSPFLKAKKRCKPFLEKLHNIQAMQRKGYSLKRGESLRAKEDKARDKWWQCEHSSRAKFKASYGGKKKEKKKTKKSVKKKTSYAKVNKILTHPKSMTASFNQSSAVVIKSKYEGDKLSDWLQFYQQPVKCQRPKSLNVFAYCSEDKLQQQSQFELKYIQ
jgi:hypothetical protein